MRTHCRIHLIDDSFVTITLGKNSRSYGNFFSFSIRRTKEVISQNGKPASKKPS
jgi:hypothetical protein